MSIHFDLFDVINKIAGCLHFPYFLIFLFIPIACYSKQKKPIIFICIVSLLFVLWRAFFHISSSRYCAIFVLILFLLLYLSPKNKLLISNKFILFTICFLVAYNLISSFSSFSNIYLLDAKDYISHAHNVPSRIVIDQKEFFRLRPLAKSSEHNYYSIDSKKEIDSIFSNYINNMFLCKEVLYCIKEDSSKTGIYHTFLDKRQNKQTCTKICQFATNYKKSLLSLYLHNSFSPSPFQKADQHDLFGRPVIYDADKNVFVFFNDKRFYLFLSSDYGGNTIITYDLRSSAPNLLPIRSLKSLYDNRGFRIKQGKTVGIENGFRILQLDIPQEYPISTILLAIKTEDNKAYIWKKSFYYSDLLD